MKWSVVLAPLSVLIAAATLSAASRVMSLEPTLASPGDELVITGTELASANVDKLYITVGSTDIEVEILEQAAEQMRFRLPDDVPHARYNVMLLTAGDTPAYLVQPVMCEVLSAADVAERQAEEEALLKEIEAAAAAEEEAAEEQQ
jgi:hypothetical protein